MLGIGIAQYRDWLIAQWSQGCTFRPQLCQIESSPWLDCHWSFKNVRSSFSNVLLESWKQYGMQLDNNWLKFGEGSSNLRFSNFIYSLPCSRCTSEEEVWSVCISKPPHVGVLRTTLVMQMVMVKLQDSRISLVRSTLIWIWHIFNLILSTETVSSDHYWNVCQFFTQWEQIHLHQKSSWLKDFSAV